MITIWKVVSSFFRPAQNDQFARLLLRLADTAVACAAHFRETGGLGHTGIIDVEHRGDAVVTEIHELLDNAFILRFDIADCMRLTDDLDNVIDGMRKSPSISIFIGRCLRRSGRKRWSYSPSESG